MGSKKLLLAIAFLFGFSVPAAAQNSPCPYPLSYGEVLTAAQWNGCLAYGINALPIAGGTLIGPLITTPSTVTSTGFNIPWGIAPTSPNNGDIWGTNGQYFTSTNGTTYPFVLGPTSSTNNHIVTFNGTSGGLIQDSGAALPSSGTLVATATASPAQGDVLYYSATGWVDLAAGSSGTFLKSNGAAANPSWSNVTAPSGTVITNTASPAQGDVLYYNGSSWTDLGHGTSGQFLETLGASANPAWATISATGCTISGGTQFNPIVNNGSSGCQNDTSALLNGAALTLGSTGSSNGTITFDTSGANGSPNIVVDSAADITIHTSTTDGLASIAANTGIQFGSYTSGPTFTIKLDYNVTNSSAWTPAAAFDFPNGDLVLEGSSSGTTILNAASTAGSTTATLPANTGTIAETNLTQTWTNPQGFNNGDFLLNGSSSGDVILKTLNPAASGTISFPNVTDTIAVLGTADQSLSGGVVLTSYNIGTVSSGTTTVDCGKNPSQYLTNNGAFTLAAPSNDGTCILKITNGSSAGTITFSGFTEGSNTGDPLDTTNTHIFFLSVMRTNGTSHYLVSAGQ